MQIANGWIVLNQQGSSVYRKLLTPAEAQLLRYNFESSCGGNPITQLELVEGEAAVIVRRDDEEPGNLKKATLRKRTSADEIRRLRGKSPDSKVEKLFPGLNPQLPQTFEEAGFEFGKEWQASETKGAKSQVNRLKGPASDEDFVFMDVPEGFDMQELNKEA